MSRDAREATKLEWLGSLPPPSRDLPRAQRDVLIQLALAMNGDGSGWVPSKRLQREAAAGKSTVTRAIAWAQEHGWLDRTSRGHRIDGDRAMASTYRLLLPAGANASRTDALGGEAKASANEALGLEPRRQTSRAKASNRGAKASNRGAKASPNEALIGPFTFGPFTVGPPQVVHDGSLRSLLSDPPLRSGSDSSSRTSRQRAKGKARPAQRTANGWVWSSAPEVVTLRERFAESGMSSTDLKRDARLTRPGLDRFLSGVGQTSRLALARIERAIDAAEAALRA